ncbi:MAG: hypothetical protein ACPGO5_01915 [Patescibacteria group bacterium]
MQGFVNAKQTYYHAIKNVPAYASYLELSDYNTRKSVGSYIEWSQIPLTSKESYILKYSVDQLQDKLSKPPIVYASSGSTGSPTFWFGSDQQEALSLLSHKKLFSGLYNIKKGEPTLVVISFAMDLWMAGHHTLAACRGLSRQGFNITTATPGYSVERTLSVLSSLGNFYKNIVLAGHPAFVMDIVLEAKKLKLLDNNKKYKVLVTGSKISEEWRDDLLTVLGQRDPFSICSVYGSTDAGKMAYETPLTISLRKKLPTSLLMTLFDSVDAVPGLYQFHPRSIFFERVNKQLIITINTPIPLVRYNIKDKGCVLTINELLKKSDSKLIRNIVEKFPAWNLPIVAVTGRSNVCVTFYALHIYPEHILAGIESRECKKFLTGKFFSYSKLKNKSKEEIFTLVLELSKNLKVADLTDADKVIILESIVRNLKRLNIEYSKLLEMIKSKALPSIVFKEYNEKNFYPKQVNGVYLDSTGKPKIITKK